MATKTISIDIEAYKRLKSARRENESFSQVIKRVVREPVPVAEWLKRIEGRSLSRQAVEAVEQQVKRRRTTSARER